MRDFLSRILPESVMEQVEKESRSWYYKCGCGHEFDVWSMGGVRFKAGGDARRLVTCPECNQTDLLRLNKRE